MPSPLARIFEKQSQNCCFGANAQVVYLKDASSVPPCCLSMETRPDPAYWFSLWIIAGACLRGGRYSDSDLPLPGARVLPCSFKSGLSCCPKWCVAPHVEWTTGQLTCCWAGPLNTSPDRSYPHTHTHDHTKTQIHRYWCTHTQWGGWGVKQLNIPCAAAVWALFSFPVSTLTPVSHVYSGNGGHGVLLGAGNRLKDSEMIQGASEPCKQ